MAGRGQAHQGANERRQAPTRLSETATATAKPTIPKIEAVATGCCVLQDTAACTRFVPDSVKLGIICAIGQLIERLAKQTYLAWDVCDHRCPGGRAK